MKTPDKEKGGKSDCKNCKKIERLTLDNTKARKYKCPDCKKKTMTKMVYTEERCNCGHVNHNPHRNKGKK